MATYDFIADPGHGWLKVPYRRIVELGIADQVSSYSYVRGTWVYLEEDCDAGAFMRAAAEAGETVRFRERVCRERQSRVRGYARYQGAMQ